MRCAFLPRDCSVMENGKPELMHHMVHPKLPGVYFLGFIQAHGPMIPCFEAQMPYAADLIQAGSLFCTPSQTPCSSLQAEQSRVAALSCLALLLKYAL